MSHLPSMPDRQTFGHTTSTCFVLSFRWRARNSAVSSKWRGWPRLALVRGCTSFCAACSRWPLPCQRRMHVMSASGRPTANAVTSATRWSRWKRWPFAMLAVKCTASSSNAVVSATRLYTLRVSRPFSRAHGPRCVNMLPSQKPWLSIIDLFIIVHIHLHFYNLSGRVLLANSLLTDIDICLCAWVGNYNFARIGVWTNTWCLRLDDDEDFAGC